jgi:hypothetical protein
MLCYRIIYYTDVEFRMILLLWHDCIPCGLMIYAAIVIIYGVMELHSILHEITIAITCHHSEILAYHMVL